MGLEQKNQCRIFFQYVEKFDKGNPETYKDCDYNMNFQEMAIQFKLDENTLDFNSHAVALHSNDNFLARPALETIEKMQLYIRSTGRYGNTPFIYPIYGLGGISEAFSRICALNNGTFILNRSVDEILKDTNGKFIGIKSQGESFFGKMLISEPSYLLNSPNKVKSTGKVIRCICILDHHLLNTEGSSCMIILPQKQIKRKHDIFITVLDHKLCVVKNDLYLAIISTIAETNEEPLNELKPALDIIGNVLETFISVSDSYEPVDCSFNDGIFISSSYDPQSHFEQDSEEVLSLYQKITGKELDLNVELD